MQTDIVEVVKQFTDYIRGRRKGREVRASVADGIDAIAAEAADAIGTLNSEWAFRSVPEGTASADDLVNPGYYYSGVRIVDEKVIKVIPDFPFYSGWLLVFNATASPANNVRVQFAVSPGGDGTRVNVKLRSRGTGGTWTEWIIVNEPFAADDDFVVTDFTEEAKWWNNTGGYSANENLKHSQAIPVQPGKTYYITGFSQWDATLKKDHLPQATGGAFLNRFGQWVAPLIYPYNGEAGQNCETYAYRYPDVTKAGSIPPGSETADDAANHGSMPYALMYAVTPPDGAAYISLNLRSKPAPDSHGTRSLSTMPVFGVPNSGDRRWAKDDPLRKPGKKLYIISPSNGTVDRGMVRAIDYQSYIAEHPDYPESDDPMDSYSDLPRYAIVGFQEYLRPYYGAVTTLAFSGCGYRIPKAAESDQKSILRYLKTGHYYYSDTENLQDADDIVIYANNNNTAEATLGTPFNGDESTYCGALESLIQWCYGQAGNRPVRIFFFTGGGIVASDYAKRQHRYTLEICRKYHIAVINNRFSDSQNEYVMRYFRYDWYRHSGSVDYRPNGMHSNNRGNRAIADRLLGALLYGAGVDMVSLGEDAYAPEASMISWESGRISTATGADLESGKHVRSGYFNTNGRRHLVIESKMRGMFYVYEYKSGHAYANLYGACVPGQRYDLSERTYSVRITFALNPQADIRPEPTDGAVLLGVRSILRFTDAYEEEPAYDATPGTISWESGGIDTATGADLESGKHVRSGLTRTYGRRQIVLDSETVGIFYIFEYSSETSYTGVHGQCVPGEIYKLSETAYAVRITFELNPQAKISPDDADATKVAGGRTRIIFAGTTAYEAYENRMRYPAPGWQNGNLVAVNGYYSTESHYSSSLASYPLLIGKAGKIFLKSIDQFLVFAVFQYDRNGQLLAPPTSNLKENAAVDVLEDAYCYRVTAHYQPPSDDPSKWPDITPKAAGCDRVTLLTGPSLFSMQAWTMYDALHNADPGPMLTIIDDDGNAKFYTDVLPIVQEEHVPIACAFITGKPGPTDNHMTWEQVVEANRSGAEILCHTYNHWSGDDISGKSKHDMSDEYRKAKFTLEQHGVQSNLLVYSGSTGLYSQSNKGAAAAGFKGAFLAGDNVSNVRGSIDPFRIKRYRIGSDYAWNFNTLKTLLDSLVSNGGWMVWMMHTSDAARWTDGTGDTPDAKAVLREVCRYAKTLNIEIVTAEAGFHAYCE